MNRIYVIMSSIWHMSCKGNPRIPRFIIPESFKIGELKRKFVLQIFLYAMISNRLPSLYWPFPLHVLCKGHTNVVSVLSCVHCGIKYVDKSCLLCLSFHALYASVFLVRLLSILCRSCKKFCIFFSAFEKEDETVRARNFYCFLWVFERLLLRGYFIFTPHVYSLSFSLYFYQLHSSYVVLLMKFWCFKFTQLLH